MAGKATVGDYVTLQRGITYKGNLVGKPGPALLGLGSIHPGGGFREGDYKTYGGECPPKLVLHPGDLFVSLKGATKDGKMIGSVARVPPSVPSGRLTQDTVKLQFTDSSRETANFLYWILRTPQYRDYCDGRATRSAVVALSRDDFLAYPVPPVTPTRMHIVELLEDLDDKIELNRRMNATLEAMARALFQSWFVDFDPVRAKLDGRKPDGLDEVTAVLFPEHLEDSPLGHIPQGWEVCPLANKIELLSGGTPKTSEPEYWDGDIPWYSVKDAPSDTDVWVIQTEKCVTQLGIDNSAAQILSAGTTIISARGTVGKLALVGIPMAMNQSCYGVRGTAGYGDFYTYFALRQATADLQQRTHGTVFDTITRQTFETLDCIFPPANLTLMFDQTVAPLLAKIRANLHQSCTLATLRDTLLPRLLSGELSLAPTAAEIEAIT